MGLLYFFNNIRPVNFHSTICVIPPGPRNRLCAFTRVAGEGAKLYGCPEGAALWRVQGGALPGSGAKPLRRLDKRGCVWQSLQVVL